MTRLRHTASQLDVYINGAPLPDEVANSVMEVVVDQHTHLPNMFRIRLYDQTLELIDGNLFALTNSVEIVGIKQTGEHISLIKGEITAVEPTFGEGMIAELVVQGYDKSHRLYRETHTESYFNVKDSDLASRFAGRAGLSARVDDTTVVYDHIFQNNQSDLSFLAQRAWRIGYECFIDEETLYFRKPVNNGGGKKLAWGQDLISFRPRVSLAEQVSEVAVRGWDPQRQEPIVGRAQRGALYPESRISGSSRDAERFGRGKKIIVNQPVVSQAEADRLAQARLDEISGSFIEADGEAFRRPDVRAGQLVTLEELGEKYSGAYMVTNATHVFSPEGLRVYFKVRGSRLGTLAEQMTHKEPLDRWPSVVTAIVTNTDDPLNWGRVKVIFPWMSEDSESDWARVIGPGGGPDAGFIAVPGIGDEVLVAFELGDFSRPFILGGVWSSNLPNPRETKNARGNEKPLVRSWRSRHGHWLSMHDDREQKIHMETTSGRRLVLSDTNSYMELVSGPSTSKIRIDDADRRIEIETSSGHKIVLDDKLYRIQIKTKLWQSVVLDDKIRTISISNHINSIVMHPAGIHMVSRQDVVVKSNKDLYLQATSDVFIRGTNIKLQKYNKATHGALGAKAEKALKAAQVGNTLGGLI